MTSQNEDTDADQQELTEQLADLDDRAFLDVLNAALGNRRAAEPPEPTEPTYESYYPSRAKGSR